MLAVVRNQSNAKANDQIFHLFEIAWAGLIQYPEKIIQMFSCNVI
jgi:hypothetical protein